MSVYATPKTDFAPGDITTAAQLNTYGNDIVVLATNNILSVALSGDYTLTGSYADVTGMSLSLNKIGDWIVIAPVHCYIDSTGYSASGHINVRLDVGGTPESAIIDAYPITDILQTQVWKVNVPSGTVTIKLQAKITAGASTSKLKATNTKLWAIHVNAA